MGGFGYPAFNAFITQCWGSPSFERGGLGFLGASNVVVGTNPPYYISDFLNFYPKFGGAPMMPLPTGSTTQGTNVISSIATIGMAIGNLITGPGIPSGTYIQALSPDSITLSQSATATSTGAVYFNIYNAPLVPMFVLQSFVTLAAACLVQARWQDMWAFAMALVIAHYATLYLRSEGDINCTAGQAAASGLNVGITVQKSAGPVSQGLQLVSGLDNWSMWEMTIFGVQFASLAKVIGGGPLLLI